MHDLQSNVSPCLETLRDTYPDEDQSNCERPIQQNTDLKLSDESIVSKEHSV